MLSTRAFSSGTRDVLDRRDFLLQSIAFGVVTLVPLACNDAPVMPAAKASLDLRTDTGIENALYALDQLAGDFYTRVTQRPYIGMTTVESTMFTDMTAHTSAVMQWHYDRLRSARIYDLLEFDFGAVDFDSRSAVYEVAEDIADRCAAAYTVAATTTGDADVRAVFAKMASVKHRHAAVVRAFANPLSGSAFADRGSVESDGLTPTTSMTSELAAVRQYFRTTLTVRS